MEAPPRHFMPAVASWAAWAPQAALSLLCGAAGGAPAGALGWATGLCARALPGGRGTSAYLSPVLLSQLPELDPGHSPGSSRWAWSWALLASLLVLGMRCEKGVRMVWCQRKHLTRPGVLERFLEVAGLQEQAGEPKGHLASDTHARWCSGPTGPHVTALTLGLPWPRAAWAPGGPPQAGPRLALRLPSLSLFPALLLPRTLLALSGRPGLWRPHGLAV